MSTIFLLGAIQAFFLVIILLAKRPLSKPDRFLTGWMAFLALHLFTVYLGASGFYKQYPNLIGYDTAFMLVQGPLLLLYIRLSTSPDRPLPKSWFLHFIPFFMLSIAMVLLLQGPEVADRYVYVKATYSAQEHPLILLLGFLLHFHLLAYLFASLVLLKKLKKRMADEFSYSEGVDLKWLRSIVFGLSTVAVLILLGLLMSDLFSFVSHQIKAYAIYAAFSFIPFYLLFQAIRQGIVYPVMNQSPNATKYNASSLDRAGSAQLAQELSQLMGSEKPYLNGKLTLADLSAQLNIPPKHLSQVVNENFGLNFFNYINGYRVTEVKERLKSGNYTHLTLLGIALDSGFNSKSSFNSIFRKVTGQTPQAFKAGLK